MPPASSQRPENQLYGSQEESYNRALIQLLLTQQQQQQQQDAAFTNNAATTDGPMTFDDGVPPAPSAIGGNVGLFPPSPMRLGEQKSDDDDETEDDVKPRAQKKPKK